ncbi:hypothetical protein AC1031_003515 [Aphanomyces cochlioides]|nr:hypothetical protein AC1031_003515 [Aphanomyces cochlioides]
MLAWNEVAQELANTPRGVKKKPLSHKVRFEFLVEKEEKKDMASLRKSGSSEQIDERDQLLVHIRARMADFAESADVRRDASKRKQEGVENSGVLMRRMAMEELTPQGLEKEGEEHKRKKIKAVRTASVDMNNIMEVIRSGIEERANRESRATSLMEKRLKFDQEQAARQAEQFASTQRILMDAIAALIKK